MVRFFDFYLLFPLKGICKLGWNILNSLIFIVDPFALLGRFDRLMDEANSIEAILGFLEIEVGFR